jgi:hypothetical protein
MKAAMTVRERLLAAIRRQQPDRVPICPRYYDYLLGVEGCACWAHYFLYGRKMGIDPILILEPTWHNYLFRYPGPYDDLPGVDVSIDVTNDGERTLVRRRFKTPAGDLTGLLQVPTRGTVITFDHLIEPLVKDHADLEKVHYLLPEPATAYLGELPVVREMVGDAGLVEVRPIQGTDQMLVDALGIQASLMLYYDDRDLLKQLLHLFNDYNQGVMRKALEAGAEMIFDAWYNCSMSVGWSPAQFKELFLPYIRANVELVHSYGAIYHYYDDGKMEKTLGMVADAGVDVIETLSPPPMGDVDLASAKARIGDRVCLKGNVDQVNVILQGTPQQIRDAVRRTVKTGAPRGGFILSTSDSIRPETPVENVQAFFDAAREYAAGAYAR